MAKAIRCAMVKIVIENLDRKELEVNNSSKTVLNHLHEHYLDWMHACGAKGRCTTCKMVVVNGAENLNEFTYAEIKYKNRGELGQNERLACQAKASGDIIIRVPNSGKLPHMNYSDE
ncbi:MAG TPA: 2Fe-2S iron-sulfur cluster-binding protein [Cyclobacteriaceae bacterium]|nr:2Fe-2S iron-sulfur cluster-binding protein [Cyclobacteriaceae bacterium]